MLAAISGALAETVPEDRGELARWAWRRMILAVAHEQGFAVAAAEAYAIGDVLAVCAR